MKNYHFKHIIISSLIMCCIVYSCTKTEPTPTPTPTPPPVVVKLTSCDSLKQGFLKNTSDTLRLLSCLTITGCDSLRLGIIKPTLSDTLRLISCIKITGCDSLRLGILKPAKNDTLRLTSCIKITGCDSLRLGVLKPNRQDSIRLANCLKLTGCDSLSLGILKPTRQDSIRLSCISFAYLGKIYKGGEVFYVDATGEHGLVVSGTLPWNEWGEDIETKATSTTDGYANTIKILDVYKNSKITSAAKLANDLRDGGFTDWYLPSKNEMQTLYDYYFGVKNSKEVVSALWTSTETLFGKTDIVVYSMTWGPKQTGASYGQFALPKKTTKYYTKAIRKF
jgi:hypothetical protein